MASANKLLDQILRGGADANIPFSGMVQLPFGGRGRCSRYEITIYSSQADLSRRLLRRANPFQVLLTNDFFYLRSPHLR